MHLAQEFAALRADRLLRVHETRRVGDRRSYARRTIFAAIHPTSTNAERMIQLYWLP